MAATVESLRALQASVNQAVDAYIGVLETKGAAADEETAGAAKRRAAQAASGLLEVVKDPFFEMLHLSMSGTIPMVVRIAIDLDLFNIIQKDVTLDELAKKTGADPSVIVRILRLLIASGIFSESPEGRVYSETPSSAAIRLPYLRDVFKHSFDFSQRLWTNTPPFLRKNGFKEIDDVKNNPCTDLHGGATYFEALSKDPEMERDFASAMKIHELVPKSAMPDFPWSEGVASFNSRSPGKDGVFIVDVAGGHGQFLSSLLNDEPDLPGRKVLQDFSRVLDAVPESEKPRFESVEYDFFTPQPVKGAKYYHLRNIMHDWPEESNIAILKNVGEAFEKGYSRLLLQGWVFPEVGCPAFDVMLDLHMWNLSGKERTEKEYKELLEKAGYEVVRTIMAPGRPWGIIEAKLAGDN